MIVLVMIVIFFGLIFLLAHLTSSPYDKRDKEFHERNGVTPERIESANRLMKTQFFDQVFKMIIEKIKKGDDSNYYYIDADAVRGYEDLGDYGSHTEEICAFSDLGYRALTGEETTILAIALQNTGYFKHEIKRAGYNRFAPLRVELRLAQHIKTYKEIEREKNDAEKNSNLKDIY